MYTHFAKNQTMLGIWMVCLKKNWLVLEFQDLCVKIFVFYNDIQKRYFRIYGMIQKSRVERALMTAHQVKLLYNVSIG